MANQEKGPGMAGARAASDIELAKGGAQYVEGEEQGKFRLEATAEQVAEAREQMERDLAGQAEAEKESAVDVKARLDEIAARTEQIKQELGKIELAVDLSNDNYVPRSQRPQESTPVVQGFGDNRPARAQGKGYYAGSVPTTAPPIEKKKGLIDRLFGN